MIEALFEIWDRLAEVFTPAAVIVIIILLGIIIGLYLYAKFVTDNFFQTSNDGMSVIEDSAKLHSDNNKKIVDMHTDVKILMGMVTMLSGIKPTDGGGNGAGDGK